MGVLSRHAVTSPQWAATRWSVVGSLGGEAGPSAVTAWDWLLKAYEAPLLRFAQFRLRRVRGRGDEDDAREVLQAFFAACLEKGWLAGADPERGSFRAYVRTVLGNFIVSQARYDGAQKRRPRGATGVLSLPEDADAEMATSALREEEEAFDREWVGVAINRALDRLREERERYYAVVHDLILTHGEGSPDLAERLGIRPVQMPVLRHRARARFASYFADELAKTVGDEASYVAEWDALAPYMP